MSRLESRLADEAIERLAQLHSGRAGAAERLDFLHALPPEQVQQLRVDHLDALAVRRAAFARIDGEREIEVVDHRQQILEQRRHGPIRLFAALALDALAVVVELGDLSHVPVVVLVALALEGLDLRLHGGIARPPLLRCGIRLIGRTF